MQYEFRGESSPEYDLFMRKVLRGVSAGYGDLSAAQCGEIVAAAVPLFERYRRQGGSVGFGGELSFCGGTGAAQQVRLGATVGEGCERLGKHGDDSVELGDEREGTGSGSEDGGAAGVLFAVDVGGGEVSGGLSFCDADVGRGMFSEVEKKGKNWKKNQRKSANRKKRNQIREVNADAGHRDAEWRFEGVDHSEEVNADAGLRSDGRRFGGEKTPLRRSLEEKWQAENELKIARARKELDLLLSEDRDAIKKLRDRKVQGATERTMVQIEKAHASLVQTGNVPGVQPVQGFCQTVVDGEIVETVPELSEGESKGCSISPSSSISEREVREMKKELEDLRAQCEKEKKEKEKMKERFAAVAGLSAQEETAFSLYNGTLPETVKDALDKVHGLANVDFSYPGPHDPDTVYLRVDYAPVPGEYDCDSYGY